MTCGSPFLVHCLALLSWLRTLLNWTWANLLQPLLILSLGLLLGLPSEPPALSSSLVGETREQILASFPACPDSCLHSARRLVGLVSDTEFRIRRAWLAGQWARAVLDGRISTPSRTPQIRVRSRIYVVLRTSSSSTPRCFSSSQSYWRCIRTLQDTESISHSFPSETEARVYCSAAGVVFPQIEP